MVDERKRLGARGESAAARRLRRQGFVILHRNYTCDFGEIDIVARKCDLLVFAEVKTRSSEEYGPPEMAVNHEKQRRYNRLAEHYMRRYRLENLQCRFDIVSVVPQGWFRMSVKHYPAAFGAVE